MARRAAGKGSVTGKGSVRAKAGAVPKAPRTRPAAGAGKRARRQTPAAPSTRRVLVQTLLEACALGMAALVAVIAALGLAAARFTGSGLWSSLLPFAAAVLLLGVLIGGSLWAWMAARRWLAARFALLPLIAAVILAVVACWFASRPGFELDVQSLRVLVGGRTEAERRAVSHQVYAAYRRADPVALRRLYERASVFEPGVREAARAFDVDPEILMGIGAVESGFEPRDSADGGRGLFQVTAPPAAALAAARARLGGASLDLHDYRHNAYVAAATLRRYLDDMNGDLFLGLLAYNIGPDNGGLLSIMRQYGATDFVTIQPYLQHLPRDYPIRVLAAALAYRLWRTQGRLPRYEDGDNAAFIQRLGIPGD